MMLGGRTARCWDQYYRTLEFVFESKRSIFNKSMERNRYLHCLPISMASRLTSASCESRARCTQALDLESSSITDELHLGLFTARGLEETDCVHNEFFKTRTRGGNLVESPAHLKSRRGRQDLHDQSVLLARPFGFEAFALLYSPSSGMHTPFLIILV